MAYLNKVQLIGNIGKDPAISASAAGRKRVSFSLATSRRYRDNNGEQKEQTDWHNIVGWGKVADIFEQLGVQKGTTLYVEGTLTNRSWTDQATGQKRYSTEVNIENFQILSSRNTQGTFGNGASNGNAYSANQKTRPQPAYNSSDEDDTDLPF